MNFLAILASVPFESELILSQMKNPRKTKIAGKPVYKGKLSGLNLLLMNTGIGKVNAAHSATGIIEHFPINPAPPQLSCESKKRGCGVKSGSFVTVSATTGTHKRALELEKRFNAICENMEGAAIAHICTIYKIHMLEIRGISNIVGEQDRKKRDLKLASENCQKAVLKIIKTI